MAGLRKFQLNRAGLWSSKVEILVGPHSDLAEQKTCVGSGEPGDVVEKLNDLTRADKYCKMSVVEDNANSAVLIQKCQVGSASTMTSMNFKKISADSFTILAESTTNGKVTSKTLTTSKYVGPCVKPDKAAETSKTNKPIDSKLLSQKLSGQKKKNCEQCSESLNQLKTQCASKAGQEKTRCQGAIPRIEAACQLNCQ